MSGDFLETSRPLLAWVGRTTWEASLIAVLVLAAQWLLRGRVSARWRYNLWLLVVARLVLPTVPGSRASPFNFVQLPSTAVEQRAATPRAEAPLGSPNRGMLPGRVPAPSHESGPGWAPAPRSSGSLQFVSDPSRLVEPRLSGETTRAVAREALASMSASPTPSPAPSPAPDKESTVAAGTAPFSFVAGVVETRPATVDSAVTAGVEAPTRPVSNWSVEPPAVFASPRRIETGAAPSRVPSPSPSSLVAPAPVPWFQRVNWFAVVAVAWVAGAAFVASRLAWVSLRLALAVRKLPAVTDPALLMMMHDCARRLRMSRTPRLLRAPDTFGPALVGLLRPCVLLPDCVIGTGPVRGLDRPAFHRHEVRLILMHELAHMKRWDVAANWLLAALGVLHWFNPALWLAFRRMRADRELACDEMVLSAADGATGGAYGPTILKLLQTLSRGRRAVPVGMVGVLEGVSDGFLTRFTNPRSSIRRRIAMIARFDRQQARHRGASALGVTLSVLATGVALTGAVKGQQAARDESQLAAVLADDAPDSPEAAGDDAAREARDAAREADNEAREAANEAREAAREAANEVREAAREALDAAREQADTARQQLDEAKQSASDRRRELDDAAREAERAVADARREAADQERQSQQAIDQAKRELDQARQSATRQRDEAARELERAKREVAEERDRAKAEAADKKDENDGNDADKDNGNNDAEDAAREKIAQQEEAVREAAAQGEQAIREAEQQVQEAVAQQEQAIKEAHAAIEEASAHHKEALQGAAEAAQEVAAAQQSAQQELAAAQRELQSAQRAFEGASRELPPPTPELPPAVEPPAPDAPPQAELPPTPDAAPGASPAPEAVESAPDAAPAPAPDAAPAPQPIPGLPPTQPGPNAPVGPIALPAPAAADPVPTTPAVTPTPLASPTMPRPLRALAAPAAPALAPTPAAADPAAPSTTPPQAPGTAAPSITPSAAPPATVVPDERGAGHGEPRPRPTPAPGHRPATAQETPGMMPGMMRGMGGYGSGMPMMSGTPGMPGMGMYPGMGAMPPGTGPAAAGRVEDPSSRAADARTTAKLQKAVPVELNGVGLADALDMLADKAGIDVVTDWKALESAGVNRDAAVSLRFRQEVPAEQVLAWVLRTAAGDAAAFAIDHGVVVVSTKEQLDRIVLTRAYDVRSIHASPNDMEELVRESVSPASWRQSGGPASARVFQGQLFVTATEPNHRQVERLLGLMKAQGMEGGDGNKGGENQQPQPGAPGGFPGYPGGAIPGGGYPGMQPGGYGGGYPGGGGYGAPRAPKNESHPAR